MKFLPILIILFVIACSDDNSTPASNVNNANNATDTGSDTSTATQALTPNPTPVSVPHSLTQASLSGVPKTPRTKPKLRFLLAERTTRPVAVNREASSIPAMTGSSCSAETTNSPHNARTSALRTTSGTPGHTPKNSKTGTESPRQMLQTQGDDLQPRLIRFENE
jgi:hypothetical protein